MPGLLRIFTGLILLLFCLQLHARPVKISTVNIAPGVTSTGASASFQPWGSVRSFHAASQTTAGAGTFDVDIEVSNDNATWFSAGTITLVTSTTAIGDGFTTAAPWRYIRANVTAITGTGASGNVYMGTEGN